MNIKAFKNFLEKIADYADRAARMALDFEKSQSRANSLSTSHTISNGEIKGEIELSYEIFKPDTKKIAGLIKVSEGIVLSGHFIVSVDILDKTFQKYFREYTKDISANQSGFSFLIDPASSKDLD